MWQIAIDLFLRNRGNAYDGQAAPTGSATPGLAALAEDRGFPVDASDGPRADFADYDGAHEMHGTAWLT